jgi:hypothetical protein
VASAKKLIEYKSGIKIWGSWNKKIGTRLARRNKMNLNTEQKYRDHGSKKEQIEFKHGTKI